MILPAIISTMSDMNSTPPIIISLDGNIGSGKTTLLDNLQKVMPEAEILLEPVAEWLTLKNAEGKSLLELFYNDKRRWAYTFQNCAILTRLRATKKAMETTTKKVIITERSVLTDRFIFAEMLRDSGDIDALEWQLYMNWFETFASNMPHAGIIYLSTGVGTSAGRIVKRGRHGEDHIPLDYLSALDDQHHKWISTTDLPVLQISTEEGASVDENVAKIRAFVDGLLASAPVPNRGGGHASTVKMGDAEW
jgi:deoxyadenosine/deoxycytidine kinase